MNELLYDELLETINNMIFDGVQLVHGGQIFGWEDTKILDILENIKKSNDRNYTESIPFCDN